MSQYVLLLKDLEYCTIMGPQLLIYSYDILQSDVPDGQEDATSRSIQAHTYQTKLTASICALGNNGKTREKHSFD
jgi:hypothetical protein